LPPPFVMTTAADAVNLCCVSKIIRRLPQGGNIFQIFVTNCLNTLLMLTRKKWRH
jgi:hypothetical protein